MSEGRIFPRPAGEDTEGFYMAMDPLTGKMTGEFVAFDETNGKVLWQFQTGSGVNAPAIHLHPPGQAIHHRAVGHCG